MHHHQKIPMSCHLFFPESYVTYVIQCKKIHLHGSQAVKYFLHEALPRVPLLANMRLDCACLPWKISCSKSEGIGVKGGGWGALFHRHCGLSCQLSEQFPPEKLKPPGCQKRSEWYFQNTLRALIATSKLTPASNVHTSRQRVGALTLCHICGHVALTRTRSSSR